MAGPTATVQNRVRIAGAGFTLFTFNSQPIAFCEQVAHTSPRPVSPPSNIQPMDEPYVVEILMAPAAGPGTLVLNMYELFGSNNAASKAWDRLGAGVGQGLGTPFGQVSSAGQNNTSQYLQNITPGNGYFAGAVDIVDLFILQAQQDPTKMAISKIIRPLSAGAQAPAYTEDYQGCVITDVVDGETVAVGTKEVIKQITVQYRYLLRNGVPSLGFKQRDNQQGVGTPQNWPSKAV